MTPSFSLHISSIFLCKMFLACKLLWVCNTLLKLFHVHFQITHSTSWVVQVPYYKVSPISPMPCNNVIINFIFPFTVLLLLFWRKYYIISITNKIKEFIWPSFIPSLTLFLSLSRSQFLNWKIFLFHEELLPSLRRQVYWQ